MESFGANRIELFRVLDLKSLCDAELNTGHNAMFPSPDFGVVTSEFISQVLNDTETREKYFKKRRVP